MKIPRGQTDARRAYMREYVRTHPKRDRRAYKAAYDQAHRQEIKEWREANRDRLKEKSLRYYVSNRERILERVKHRSESIKGQISAYQARYYLENAGRVKARIAAYQAANPEKKWHMESKRRARKAANGGSHTLEELIQKFADLGSRCFYCGVQGKLTIDHDVPLSRGGTDYIDNILPACRSCNSRKNKKTGAEFIEWLSTNHAAIGGIGAKPLQKYEGR